MRASLITAPHSSRGQDILFQGHNIKVRSLLLAGRPFGVRWKVKPAVASLPPFRRQRCPLERKLKDREAAARPPDEFLSPPFLFHVQVLPLRMLRAASFKSLLMTLQTPLDGFIKTSLPASADRMSSCVVQRCVIFLKSQILYRCYSNYSSYSLAGYFIISVKFYAPTPGLVISAPIIMHNAALRALSSSASVRGIHVTPLCCSPQQLSALKTMWVTSFFNLKTRFKIVDQPRGNSTQRQ